ncbi:MAG: RluA family pseudouridine synthase [Spirochaetia bacterium]|nr:RluA family pseudouridine synthase [Spirochaetia bacterium]MCF7946327.1 RluA family pseudouridine synthase [Spirochaetia bacterium]
MNTNMQKEHYENISVCLPDRDSIRIDKYICENEALFKRSQLSLRAAVFYCNGRIVKASKKVSDGDIVEILYNDLPVTEVHPEKISLNIIFENSSVLVLNKQQGVVVHPGAGNYHNTLIQGVLFRYAQMRKAFSENNLRPGIVHRLDKDTSGIIVIAKDTETLENISSQFKNRKVEKYYITIVKGNLPSGKKGRVQTCIARDPSNRKKFKNFHTDSQKGKFADTEYFVLKQYQGYSLLRIKLNTGRTHQIRLHMKYIGHPILGDTVYGNTDKRFNESTLMLHALSIRFTLPESKKMTKFTAEMPERFKKILHCL